MLLENIFPTLPQSIIEILMVIIPLIGTFLLVYAVFIEKEHKEDIIRFLGAASLNTYAIYINNTLFIIAMSAIMIATAIEFIEIAFHLRKQDKK